MIINSIIFKFFEHMFESRIIYTIALYNAVSSLPHIYWAITISYTVSVGYFINKLTTAFCVYIRKFLDSTMHINKNHNSAVRIPQFLTLQNFIT